MLLASRITNNKVLLSIIILAFYFLGQFGSKLLYPFYGHLLVDFDRTTRVVLWQLLYYGLVPLVATVLLVGWRQVPSALGLDKGFLRGLGMAALITLPMFIGYGWMSDFTVGIDPYNLIFGSISAPFFEEFFFRAFLFGLLYRLAGWSVLPATVLDAFVFGIIHVSQGDDLVSSLSVFGVTAAGAAGFSLLYKEWDWNLWFVVFLHAFMNFAWMLFAVADNAAGGLWANVFRLMSIAIAVVWTIRHVRNKKALAQVQGEEVAQSDTARSMVSG